MSSLLKTNYYAMLHGYEMKKKNENRSLSAALPPSPAMKRFRYGTGP